jgi:hypothetical protein
MGRKFVFAELVQSRAEAAGVQASVVAAGAPGRYRAKVGQVDRVNGNGRIYPREVVEAEVRRLKPLLAKGHLGGAVDHVDDRVRLRDEALLWRDLEVRADGAIVGEFELLDTARGRDLKRLIDGGRAVGFSTSGRGTTRYTDGEDRRRYAVTPERASADPPVVVMKPDFELVAIDAVSDPSVTDARIVRESREPDVVTERGSDGLELLRELAGGELDDLGLGLAEAIARQADEELAEALEEPEEPEKLQIPLVVPEGLTRYAEAVGARTSLVR